MWYIAETDKYGIQLITYKISCPETESIVISKAKELMSYSQNEITIIKGEEYELVTRLIEKTSLKEK